MHFFWGIKYVQTNHDKAIRENTAGGFHGINMRSPRIVLAIRIRWNLVKLGETWGSHRTVGWQESQPSLADLLILHEGRVVASLAKLLRKGHQFNPPKTDRHQGHDMIIMSKYEAWPISWVGTPFLSQTRLFSPWASSPNLKKSSGKCVCLKIGYHCLSQFKFVTVAMNMGTLCCEAQKRRVGSALPGGRLLEAGDECHWLKSQQGDGRGRHRF